jgi:CheY-like chemotaxis protein
MQTIMIVEDDPDIRDGVRILLSGEGYRILDNITSNLLKYADPVQDISVRFVKENGKAGLAFENAVLPGQHRTDSTKVGLTSIETMMEKMHAACRIKQSGERFCITLLFPIALSVTPQA